MGLSQLPKNSRRSAVRRGLSRSRGSVGSMSLADSSAVSGARCRVTPVGSKFEPWAKFWYTWVSVAFVKAYLAAAKEDPILPKDPTELQVLLEVYLLEKAVYELGYELNNRPEWVKVPLQGLLQLLTANRSG